MGIEGIEGRLVDNGSGGGMGWESDAFQRRLG